METLDITKVSNVSFNGAGVFFVCLFVKNLLRFF